jgi:hypothetical protein
MRVIGDNYRAFSNNRFESNSASGHGAVQNHPALLIRSQRGQDTRLMVQPISRQTTPNTVTARPDNCPSTFCPGTSLALGLQEFALLGPPYGESPRGALPVLDPTAPPDPHLLALRLETMLNISSLTFSSPTQISAR